MAAKIFDSKRVAALHLLGDLRSAATSVAPHLAPVATALAGLFLFGVAVNRLETVAQCAAAAPVVETLTGGLLHIGLVTLALTRLGQTAFAMAGQTRVYESDGGTTHDRVLFGITLRTHSQA